MKALPPFIMNLRKWCLVSIVKDWAKAGYLVNFDYWGKVNWIK